MGDWTFGKHYSPPFTLAEAAAASAAVPYVIGALRLELPINGWYRTDPATRTPQEKVLPKHSQISLWDGGAYEIFGLEAMFKPQQPLRDCDFLICCDASGPLGIAGTGSPLSLLKGKLVAPRLFDVASDQIRSLRSRMLLQAIQDGSIRASLLRMGNSVRDIDIKANHLRDHAAYDAYQSEEDVARALSQPTELTAVSTEVFDRIARHGYEVADATLTTYSPAEFRNSFKWEP